MQGVMGLVEICRSKGLRVTPQRLAVFRVLSESDGHLSVEEVWDNVRDGLPTVSLKTVYRPSTNSRRLERSVLLGSGPEAGGLSSTPYIITAIWSATGAKP